MQTLGLSDSTPRSEGRLKSLFWPSITSSADVDYLGSQGYWICTIIAIISSLVLVKVTLLGASVIFLFYYFGGVGVRERSKFAATLMFVVYALGSFEMGISVLRVLLGVVLFSNLRATWLAARWKDGSEEAAPVERPQETWADKFANTLPAMLWPYFRYPYYVFSIGILAISVYAVVRAVQR
jgi:hypothetical protein